jgi:hypothetical protein
LASDFLLFFDLLRGKEKFSWGLRNGSTFQKRSLKLALPLKKGRKAKTIITPFCYLKKKSKWPSQIQS